MMISGGDVYCQLVVTHAWLQARVIRRPDLRDRVEGRLCDLRARLLEAAHRAGSWERAVPSRISG